MRNHLSKDRTFTINLLDRNDNVPKFATDIFTGQVEEELDMLHVKKTAIVTVVAKDNDHEPAFREVSRMFSVKLHGRLTGSSTVDNSFQITYSILPGPASNLFSINPKSGAIYALRSFDREQNDSFILDVQAEDGAVSSLPGITGPNYGKV